MLPRKMRSNAMAGRPFRLSGQGRAAPPSGVSNTMQSVWSDFIWWSRILGAHPDSDTQSAFISVFGLSQPGRDYFPRVASVTVPFPDMFEMAGNVHARDATVRKMYAPAFLCGTVPCGSNRVGRTGVPKRLRSQYDVERVSGGQHVSQFARLQTRLAKRARRVTVTAQREPLDPDDRPDTNPDGDTPPEGLSLEQELLMKNYKDQIQRMTKEQCDELAEEIVRQSMVKDNLLQMMGVKLPQEWTDPMSPAEFAARMDAGDVPPEGGGGPIRGGPRDPKGDDQGDGQS